MLLCDLSHNRWLAGPETRGPGLAQWKAQPAVSGLRSATRRHPASRRRTGPCGWRRPGWPCRAARLGSPVYCTSVPVSSVRLSAVNLNDHRGVAEHLNGRSIIDLLWGEGWDAHQARGAAAAARLRPSARLRAGPLATAHLSPHPHTRRPGARTPPPWLRTSVDKRTLLGPLESGRFLSAGRAYRVERAPRAGECRRRTDDNARVRRPGHLERPLGHAAMIGTTVAA